LVKAGRDYGLKLFGGRALNAMRIEKSFGTWAREYRPIYGPFEAGLGRFVDLKKGELHRPLGGRRGEGRRRLRCGFGASKWRRRMPMPSAMSRSGTTAKRWAG
jgi:glycine cleavage system aminomethyltransferase T